MKLKYALSKLPLNHTCCIYLYKTAYISYEYGVAESLIYIIKDVREMYGNSAAIVAAWLITRLIESVIRLLSYLLYLIFIFLQIF